MRRWWVLVLALPAAVLLPLVGSADASSCKVMTVGYAFTTGRVIAVQPERQDIDYGGCVQFTNNVDLTVTISVEGGYSTTLGPHESTPESAAYVGRQPGSHGLTARGGPSSADGTITVRAAPEQSSRPERTPPPQHTAQPAQSPPGPSSTATGPRVAPAPPTVGGEVPRSHVASPPPSVPPIAPTAPAVTTTPQPSASPSAPAVAAFPVEPPSSRGMGLPGAVAALAVVATAAALVRVLLAEPIGPVDDHRRAVGGTS